MSFAVFKSSRSNCAAVNEGILKQQECQRMNQSEKIKNYFYKIKLSLTFEREVDLKHDLISYFIALIKFSLSSDLSYKLGRQVCSDITECLNLLEFGV